MHEVAKWKWNTQKTIADANREEQLLVKLAERGREFGLSRERTRDFMTAQMEAGKLVQEADFANWRKQARGKFGDARDLNTDLRPLIDNVSDRLLAEVASMAPMLDDETAAADIERRATEILRGDGINDAVRAAALRPLLDGAAN